MNELGWRDKDSSEGIWPYLLWKKIRFGYQFSLVVRKLKKVKYSASPSLYMVYSEVCEKLFISQF